MPRQSPSNIGLHHFFRGNFDAPVASQRPVGGAVDAYTYAATLNHSDRPIADVDPAAFRKNAIEDRESLAAVSTSTKLKVARWRLYQDNPEKP